MDPISQRIVAVGLLVVTIVAMVGCFVLHLQGTHEPAGLCVIASACVGALVGMMPPPVARRPPNGNGTVQEGRSA